MTDHVIYQTARFDKRRQEPHLEYKLPVPENGLYSARLHFSDLFKTTFPGERVFTIWVEGERASGGIDPRAMYGWMGGGMVDVSGIVRDGEMNIKFIRLEPGIEAPLVNAIELFQGDVLPQMTTLQAPSPTVQVGTSTVTETTATTTTTATTNTATTITATTVTATTTTPTPCAESRHGCCLDGITTKVNKRGSNCAESPDTTTPLAPATTIAKTTPAPPTTSTTATSTTTTSTTSTALDCPPLSRYLYSGSTACLCVGTAVCTGDGCRGLVSLWYFDTVTCPDCMCVGPAGSSNLDGADDGGDGRGDGEACADATLPNGNPWHDGDGSAFSCKWFAEAPARCSLLGSIPGAFGVSAKQACCVCGGSADGMTGATPVTAAPTTAAGSVAAPAECPPDSTSMSGGASCICPVGTHCAGPKCRPLLSLGYWRREECPTCQCMAGLLTTTATTSTSMTTTSTSTSTSTDACRSLTCGAWCTAPCGWSRMPRPGYPQGFCKFGSNTKESELRLGFCPITTTSTTTTTTLPDCSQITCGKECSGVCGWSSRYGTCKRGGFTKDEELELGDCSSGNKTNTTSDAPPPPPTDPADDCNLIRCGAQCTGPCGWSKVQELCIAGGFTKENEEKLGDCSNSGEPTTITAAPTPQPGSSVCSDTALANGSPWKDMDSDGCDWYTTESIACTRFGHLPGPEGHSANTMCCSCGGGTFAAGSGGGGTDEEGQPVTEPKEDLQGEDTSAPTSATSSRPTTTVRGVVPTSPTVATPPPPTTSTAAIPTGPAVCRPGGWRWTKKVCGKCKGLISFKGRSKGTCAAHCKSQGRNMICKGAWENKRQGCDVDNTVRLTCHTKIDQKYGNDAICKCAEVAPPTPAPIPTPAPTPPPQSTLAPTSTSAPETPALDVCVDSTQFDGSPWRDSDGDGCLWYASDAQACSRFGHLPGPDGNGAKTMCCTCGGGSGGEAQGRHPETTEVTTTTESTTSSSTAKPPDVPWNVLTRPGAQCATSNLGCEQLGWTGSIKSARPAVCGVSVIAGQCQNIPVDYDTAADTCRSVGARLCSAAELKDDVTKGSGCDHLDSVYVWTRRQCSDTSAIIDAATNVPGIPARCVRASSKFSFRCCADVSPVNACSAVPIELPSGPPSNFAKDSRMCNPCEEGRNWEMWDTKGNNGCCYKHITTKRSFYSAAEACAVFGGAALASVASEREDKFITSIRSNVKDVWLGGMRTDKSTKAVNWIDGTAAFVDPLEKYINWYPTEPNDESGEDTCVAAGSAELYKKYGGITRWNDADCQQKKGFVCKFCPQNHPSCTTSTTATTVTETTTSATTKTATTKTVTTTTTLSGCEHIICGLDCKNTDGRCGWSSQERKCVAGARTSPLEETRGDCSHHLPQTNGVIIGYDGD